jgi:hypothetical protein
MSTTTTASAARTRVRDAARAFGAGHPTLLNAAVVQARGNECAAPRLLWQLAMSILMIWLISVTPAHAQLATQHIKGVVGLKGGSPPPPGTYFIAPLVYIYDTDTVRTREGNRLPIDAHISSLALAGGLNLVTTKKILGGYYGFQVLFPVWAKNRIQATEIDSNPGGGMTDSGLVPISLGWNFKRADALAVYTIYMPTGRYADGASDNTGMGMWGHELMFGSTVYLNEARKYHAATVASFNFQSKKEDSETKVGTAMNLEGGIGADFLGGGLTAGLVYYASFKLSADRIEGFPLNIAPGKNKVFALGPEVSLALARKGTLFGFVKANYQWETYARAGTQGAAFNVVATFLMKPLKVGTP